MELTADQKDLLALVARTDDEEALRARCCELGLADADKRKTAAGTVVKALCRRPDAKLYLDQQRKELERHRLDAMKEADSAGWNREKARAELERQSYELALRAVKHNLTLIDVAESGAEDAKAAPSGSSTAKLLDICRSMAGEKGTRRVRTPQEQRDLMKAAGMLADDDGGGGKPVTVSVRSMSRPGTPEGKA